MIALLALMSCTPEAPAPASDGHALKFDGKPPRNVLMLSIDTLRRDHVGRYSSEESLTPFLDGLMAQGVPLDDHTQCSNWTFPTVTCTLAGRDGVDRGHLAKLDGDHRTPVPQGTPFLATWLSEAGLDTWIFSINSWLSDDWGNTQGYAHETWPGIFHTEEIFARAVAPLEDSIAAGDTDRWFLHVHVKEPHAAYYAPDQYWSPELLAMEQPPWDLHDFYVHYDVTRDLWPTLEPEVQAELERYLQLSYDSEIRWLDHQLEAVWADLRARGLLEDTLVVVWTDHGEQFWEHGHQTHAYQLYGEETDAVAFFWADTLRPGPWTGRTTAIDLAPTVLAALDLPIPDEITGRVVGTAPADRPRYASTLARLGGSTSVERDGIKLIYDWTGTIAAHDRNTDPGETVDIYDPGDPVHAELTELALERAGREALLAPEIDRVEP